jgi:hypothetical protein
LNNSDYPVNDVNFVLTESTEEAKKKREEQLKAELKKLDFQFKHQHVLAMIGKNGTEEVCSTSLVFKTHLFS